MNHDTLEISVKKAGVDLLAELDQRSIRIVNRIFRERDDSDLWPINGRFSVAERAIRRMRRLHRHNGYGTVLEYIYGLEHDASEIVNDPKNH